jgi:hypothetical protein
VFGFATPSDLESSTIGVRITAPGHNPRHLLLDGTMLTIDLRNMLYGVS